MANSWCKLHFDVLRDPKTKFLPRDVLGNFFVLLTLKGQGALDQDFPPCVTLDAYVARCLEIDDSQAIVTKECLQAACLIDEDWQPLGWSKRQSMDADSTVICVRSDAKRQAQRERERLKKQRQRKKNAMSPDVPAMSPDVPAMSPDVPQMSPDVPTMSPDVPAMSPDVPTMSPDVPLNVPEMSPGTAGDKVGDKVGDTIAQEVSCSTPDEVTEEEQDIDITGIPMDAVLSPNVPTMSPDVPTMSPNVPTMSPNVPINVPADVPPISPLSIDKEKEEEKEKEGEEEKEGVQGEVLQAASATPSAARPSGLPCVFENHLSSAERAEHFQAGQPEPPEHSEQVEI